MCINCITGGYLVVFIIDCDFLCRSCSHITCESRGRSSQDVSIHLSVFVFRAIIRHIGGNISRHLIRTRNLFKFGKCEPVQYYVHFNLWDFYYAVE